MKNNQRIHDLIKAIIEDKHELSEAIIHDVITDMTKTIVEGGNFHYADEKRSFATGGDPDQERMYDGRDPIDVDDEIDDIPRGDQSIDDLDASGELGDHMASNIADPQILKYADVRVAELAKEILARWNVDATVKGIEERGQGQSRASRFSDQYAITFNGDDRLRDDLNAEVEKQLRAERG
ncbi:MAG: hypothetical protein KUG49_00765 [Dokdonia sp.]|nr:hypothetical protein [Dokdonia sp.]